ncbi:MAG TPA: multicopper oxidase family protein [Chloroflexia bacterium]|nr:multicopper oxidase family protein [Chloroflexia bacterium]
MIAIAARTTRRPEPPAAAPAAYAGPLLFRVALLTLGVAAIHFAVAPDHLDEYLPFGLFFIALGLAQVALAVATLWRPGRRLFAGAALGTLGVLGLWALSRTSGLPLGPTPWQPEAVGVADLLAAVLEGAAVLLFALLARGPRARRRSAGRLRRIVRVTWTTLTLLLTTLLTVALSAFGTLAGASRMPEAVNLGVAVPGQSAVSLTSLVEPPGPQPVRAFTLTAAVVQIGGQDVWTYNGTVPGPELRVTEGDRVRVTLINHLPAATSIHWHGLRLPNAEDGVAGVTQDAVPPGGTFTYEFVVKDPGTYWYHSHQDTLHQIPLGLYGALVVAPQQGPAYDRDYAVAFGDAGRTGIVANGAVAGLLLAARPGELVRLRLINAALIDMPGTPESVALVGAPYTVIALDGHDLHGPTPLGPEILPIGTGQRYDLAFRMPTSGQVRLVYAGPESQAEAEAADNAAKGPLAAFLRSIPDAIFGASKIRHKEAITLGDGPAPAIPALATLPIFDLTTYGTPAPDSVADRTSFDVSQDLHIGVVPGFRDGAFENIHLLNGQAAPDTAPILVRPGQVVRLRFINETDEYHPMHLHGHIFSVISKNGQRITGSPVHLDSILVAPHETWEVAFLADNPGLWMLHCHVLIHAAYGLMTMVDYVGITTPYTMGTRSGNMPE